MSMRSWLEDRTPLLILLEVLRHERVPIHRFSFWYFFGGITLFFFLVQVLTGCLLLLYYRPSASEAYESIGFIMTRVPFGWLVRSIHAWSGNLMIGAAFLHLSSTVFLHAYRRPRELTWMSGVLMFFVTLAFGFSGYLLPWNELAFFATRVGTDIAAVVPFVGDDLVRFLRGGPEVTGGTLTRFFGVHVAILPAVTAALLWLHLVLIQYQGLSVPPSVEAERRAGQPPRWVPFLPHFALYDLFAWTLALAALAGLAALLPWELGNKADAFGAAPAGIRPEWYFLWMFQPLKYAPATVLGINGELLVIVPAGLGALLLLLLPFIDPDTPRSRLAVKLTAALVILLMVAMTILALLEEPT